MALGGVVTNVTAATFFRPFCGEGRFCFSGLFAFLSRTVEGWMIIVGLVLSAVGSLISYLDKQQIGLLQGNVTSLQNDIEVIKSVNDSLTKELSQASLDPTKLFKLLLMDLSNDMGLGTAHRLSLYKVTSGKFFIIGRYSDNPNFCEVRRKYYDRARGAIDLAWENGWAECSVNANPMAKRRKYVSEQCAKYQLKQQVVEGFVMKSRCYKALALKNSTGATLAIICAESTDRLGLASVTREDMQQRCTHLPILLEALEHHVTSLDNAMNEGL